MFRATATTVLLFSAALTASFAAESNLIRLTDDAARCLDGTLSGYYYQEHPAEEGIDKWVIHLQGGGECDTEETCSGDLTNSLGSSNYFSETAYQPYFCQDSPDYNPDFWTYNHVYIPYCTADLHSGTITVPTEESFGMYFAGHLVFEAVVKDLTAKYGFANAKEVILSGDSAGGIGTWVNLDYLSDYLKSAGNSDVRVVGAPIAGFYFFADHPYQGPDHTSSWLTNFSASGIEHAYNVWQSYVDESCYEAHKASSESNPSACLLSNNSFPYIENEAFVIEAQTDQVVLENHDWVPPAPLLCDKPETEYVRYWHNTMTRALAPLMDESNTRNGVFNPACYIHTSFAIDGPIIEGNSYKTAMGNWYFNRTDPSGYNLADDCGSDLYCNPTCSNPCP